MKVPFVDLKAMHSEIMDEMLAAVNSVAQAGSFILGGEVAAFEEEFAAYCDTQYAIGVDSGLSALRLALEVYDIGPGAEVIVPVNTFIATAGAVTFAGATPVFVDVVPGTYNFDLDKLREAITPATRAIIPVHLYGIPADMDPIMEIADEHNLLVLEDASQAHGARYKGRRVGGIGHIAAFSLYPAKNLGAFGDAGIITTNDASIIDKLKALRNCGQTQKYHHDYAPHNNRLDTIHAAVLRIKLRELDKWNAQRRQVAAWYRESLAGLDLVLPMVAESVEPVWHLYVVQTEQRESLMKHLSEQGIGVAIHYPFPLHQTPYYMEQKLGYNDGDFPVAESESPRLMTLPMFPDMTKEQVEHVAKAIREVTAEKAPSI
jgi:dTDP-4-amino-4,6-dideoxygalactose transaminase